MRGSYATLPMMLELQHLLILSLMAAAAAYWWDAYGIKQMALGIVKARCKKLNLQLLDDSLVLRKLAFRKDSRKRVRVERRFTFEFTSTGEKRYQGVIIFLGKSLEHFDTEAHRI